MLDIETLKETLDLLRMQRKSLTDCTSDKYKSIVDCISKIHAEVNLLDIISDTVAAMGRNQANTANDLVVGILNADDIIISDKDEKCICGKVGAHYCFAIRLDGFLDPRHIKGRHKQ